MSIEDQSLPLSRSSFSENSIWWKNTSTIAWLIVGFGIIVRLVQYLSNRSLWLDESWLALNIVQKTFFELLKTLDHAQAAPVGFLFIEKLLFDTFGDGEYVLRFFPAMAGILSMFLFYSVGKRVLQPSALLIGLGIFATSEPLIYYAAELKQYSSDVAVALSVSLMGLLWLEKESKLIFNTIVFSIIGALLIWISHPAIFCLAGVGVSLAIHAFQTKNWNHFRWLSVLGFFWLSSFALNGYVSLLELSQDQRFLNAWNRSFMPTPFSGQGLMWYPMKFFQVFDKPAGFSFTGVAAFACVIGGASKFYENRHHFTLLLLPSLMALAASGLGKYPFESRLIIFLVPMIIIFVAQGVGWIMEQMKCTAPLVGVSLCVLLFVHPVPKAIGHLVSPIVREEVRPLMKYLKGHHQDGDLLYLYSHTWPAFDFYAKRFGLDEVETQQGVSSRGNWPNYVKDLNRLKGRDRVWFLFSHINKGHGVDEERFFLHVLDGMGQQIDSLKRPGASVYLYDLK